MVKGDNPISPLKPGHTATDCGHDPSGFLAVDSGRRQQIVLDLFQIRVTDPAGLHTDQNFAGTYDRSGNLLDFDHAVPAIDRGVHHFRDVEVARIGSRQ
jgi:hypothetical protein